MSAFFRLFNKGFELADGVGKVLLRRRGLGFCDLRLKPRGLDRVGVRPKLSEARLEPVLERVKRARKPFDRRFKGVLQG
jgi:hypothetical protein